jgi:hypothetical protein
LSEQEIDDRRSPTTPKVIFNKSPLPVESKPSFLEPGSEKFKVDTPWKPSEIQDSEGKTPLFKLDSSWNHRLNIQLSK